MKYILNSYYDDYRKEQRWVLLDARTRNRLNDCATLEELMEDLRVADNRNNIPIEFVVDLRS